MSNFLRVLQSCWAKRRPNRTPTIINDACHCVDSFRRYLRINSPRENLNINNSLSHKDKFGTIVLLSKFHVAIQPEKPLLLWLLSTKEWRQKGHGQRKLEHYDFFWRKMLNLDGLNETLCHWKDLRRLFPKRSFGGESFSVSGKDNFLIM